MGATKSSKRNILVIVGGALTIVVCVCSGLVLFGYVRVSSCIGELEEPVETEVAELACASGTITIVNRRTTTNWLEGVYRHQALLRFQDGQTVDVPVGPGGMREWLPDDRRPPHRIDGEVSLDGFEVFLDPAEVSTEVADAIEECLIGRVDEVTRALHTTDAHRYTPDPGVVECIVYWRAPREALEPVFTAPNGDTITLGGHGGLFHDTPTTGTSIGEVTREPDGSLSVTLHLDRWGPPPAHPVSEYRTPDGEDLEAWLGVPVIETPADRP